VHDYILRKRGTILSLRRRETQQISTAST